MAQTLPTQKLVTFEEFIEWLPESTFKRYEIHDGVIVEMSQPTGKHERVVGFLAAEVTLEYRRLDLPYFIPKTALVKPLLKASGYSPDVLLLDSSNLQNEKLWEKESTDARLSKHPVNY